MFLPITGHWIEIKLVGNRTGKTGTGSNRVARNRALCRIDARAKKNSCRFGEISEEKNQRISFVCKAKATYIVIAAPSLAALGN